MKKDYVTPYVELFELEIEDAILLSSDLTSSSDDSLVMEYKSAW